MHDGQRRRHQLPELLDAVGQPGLLRRGARPHRHQERDGHAPVDLRGGWSRTTSAEPAEPTGLLVALDLATGNPRLTWSHPNVGDVRYFRIYRDNCCDLADRYNSTGNATSWVDPNARRRPAPLLGHRGRHRPGINESQPSNAFDWPIP